MRWAASCFARRGDREGAHACAAALGADGGRGAATPTPGGARAGDRRDGRCSKATRPRRPSSFSRAVELHRDLAIPARAGPGRTARRGRPRRRRASARRRWSGSATPTAAPRKLGARPARRRAAASEVAALGESVAQRLGSRAAAAADGVQLTRRELEVLRHVAVGRTNREIAQELFLSQRTVDMHVRNLLGKLDCRSRVEASHRAGELGLLS